MELKACQSSAKFCWPKKGDELIFLLFFTSDLSKEYILQLTGEVSPTTHLCIIP